MDGEYRPKDEMWVKDVETIKVVADGRRLAILRLMQEPTTVKEISAELALSPSKLYYHVNMLEKHGLITVIDHNIDSGIVEKVYQVTARQLKLVNPLINPDVSNETTDALFTPLLEETIADFRASLAESADSQQPPRYPFVSKKSVRLTDTQLTALHAKLDTLIQEVTAMGHEDSDGDAYDLTVVFAKQRVKRDPAAMRDE